MNPLIQQGQGIFFQDFSNSWLKHEAKELKSSFRLCILSFLLVSIIDISVSVLNNYLLEPTLIGNLVLFFVLCSFVLISNQKNYLVPFLYFLSLGFVSFQIYRYGLSSGSYFYILPAAVIDNIHKKHFVAKRKTVFLFNKLMIFIAWSVLIFLISINLAGSIQLTSLILTRLIMSVILSGLLIRHFMITIPLKKAVAVNKTNVVTSENNYSAALFQSNRESFIVLDKETKEIVDYNQYTATLFELPASSSLNGLFISQIMMRHLAGNSDNLDLLMNNIPDLWQGEAKFTTTNKREFYALVNSSAFSGEEKEFQILSIRDISDFKTTESELNYYKEKLDNSVKVKTRFLSSMSHELRTPLNAIIGTANLILAEPDIPEKVKTQLGLQLYSSEHMLSIINDILDFSKIESGKMEVNKQSFKLMEAMDFLINSIQGQFTKNNIDLVINFDPKLSDVFIMSDVVKLRQVLYNLLSNALKFTIEGQVFFTVSVEETDAESISVYFNVKDTGIGIKNEKQAEIFEDFAQVHAEDHNRRFGGTGLGLTISEKLVNMFGGKIEVESEFGKGSSFYFTLTFDKTVVQVKPEVEPEESADQLLPAADIRGVRILIVEDNEINAGILIMFLQKWGIRIKEASNGIHALEMLKYHTFDLILMDLEMPEMNGYTAVKIIRETDKTIPIIAFTATLFENMESFIAENGFDDYITKPFSPSVLKKKIEKFISHRKIEYA